MSRCEIDVMRRWQRVAVRGPVPGLARAYSTWGEHSAGWVALGILGASLDPARRHAWLRVSASAFAAHAGAVVLKRVVRRPRPADDSVAVLVGTPSDLSFPSAHAASTTAAACALVPLVGLPVAMSAAASMALARVLLGVHYPSDVAAGAVLGAATAGVVRRVGPGGWLR